MTLLDEIEILKMNTETLEKRNEKLEENERKMDEKITHKVQCSNLYGFDS